MSTLWPSYLNLLESGELARRAQKAIESLADCTFELRGGVLRQIGTNE